MVPVAVHHRRLSGLKKGRFPPVPEFAAAGNRPQKEEIPLALPFRKILPVAGEIAAGHKLEGQQLRGRQAGVQAAFLFRRIEHFKFQPHAPPFFRRNPEFFRKFSGRKK